MPQPSLDAFMRTVAPPLAEAGFHRFVRTRNFVLSDPEHDGRVVLSFQGSRGRFAVGFFVNVAAGPLSYLDWLNTRTPAVDRDQPSPFGLWRTRLEPSGPARDQSGHAGLPDLWAYDDDDGQSASVEDFIQICAKVLPTYTALTDPNTFLERMRDDPHGRFRNTVQLREPFASALLRMLVDPSVDALVPSAADGSTVGADFEAWLAQLPGRVVR